MDFLKQLATFNVVYLIGNQKEKASAAPQTSWLAVAARNKQSCSFIIQLSLVRSEGNPPMGFTMGKFKRVSGMEGQDGTWFLQELMNELNVSDFPQDVVPADELPFMAVILGGLNLHRHDTGGFSSEKPGHWIPMKLTLGEQSSEVYMNLNPDEGVGEFASKSQYYGKGIVREFAKIILPLK